MSEAHGTGGLVREGDKHPVRPPGGQLARLGVWSASHLRVVLLAWAMVLLLFGAFARWVEHALAGAGWQDSTSQSVKARQIIQRQFGGLGASALQVVVVDDRVPLAADPAARSAMAKASALLAPIPACPVVVRPARSVVSPTAGPGSLPAAPAPCQRRWWPPLTALASPLHRLSGPASPSP